MSHLFSCFACTKKQKKLKAGSSVQEDKRPKERKSKQKKNKQKKDIPVSTDTVDYFNKPMPSEPLKSEPQNPAADLGKKMEPVEVHLECNKEPEPTKEEVPSLNTRDDHPNNYMEDNKNGDGDHERDKKIPQIKIDEIEKFSTTIPTIAVRRGSDGNESSDESCLTDSDLNISESVFLSEQGPRVGSGCINTSKGGIHTMKATVENEQFLERELLGHIGKHKNPNATTSLNFSLERRSCVASVEERKF